MLNKKIHTYRKLVADPPRRPSMVHDSEFHVDMSQLPEPFD